MIYGGCMATERWTDERLDRLADQIEANTRNIEANTRNISDLNQSMSQLVSINQEQQKANTTLFELLIQEIRGLRSENRRILTHLFGEDSE